MPGWIVRVGRLNTSDFVTQRELAWNLRARLEQNPLVCERSDDVSLPLAADCNVCSTAATQDKARERVLTSVGMWIVSTLPIPTNSVTRNNVDLSQLEDDHTKPILAP
jgi:hypothetical protein